MADSAPARSPAALRATARFAHASKPRLSSRVACSNHRAASARAVQAHEADPCVQPRAAEAPVGCRRGPEAFQRQVEPSFSQQLVAEVVLGQSVPRRALCGLLQAGTLRPGVAGQSVEGGGRQQGIRGAGGAEPPDRALPVPARGRRAPVRFSWRLPAAAPRRGRGTGSRGAGAGRRLRRSPVASGARRGGHGPALRRRRRDRPGTRDRRGARRAAPGPGRRHA
jgi:hypothetical protein